MPAARPPTPRVRRAAPPPRCRRNAGPRSPSRSGARAQADSISWRTIVMRPCSSACGSTLRSIEAWSADSGAPTSPLASRMLSAGRRPDSIASTTARPRSAGPASAATPSRLANSAASGRRALTWPKSSTCTRWQATPRARAASISASSRRVLPMPASPRVTMVRPRRDVTQRSSSEFISDSSAWRPANGRLCAPSERRRPSDSSTSPGIRLPGQRLGIAHRVARERKRAVDARRQQRALGDAGRRRARREVACADGVDHARAARSARCGFVPLSLSRPKTATRRSPRAGR